MNDRIAVWTAAALLGILLAVAGWSVLSIEGRGAATDAAPAAAIAAAPAADQNLLLSLDGTEQPATCQDLTYTSRNAPVKARYCRPSAEGPQVPAVVMLHGCGGPPGLPEAGRLSRAGIATLEIEYFTQTPSPGAVSGSFCRANVGRDGQRQALPVWLENVSDGVTWLQSRAEIDATRIGIIGWSLGGDVALRAAADDQRIGAVVNYSGSAGFLNPFDDLIPKLPPVLILHGDADPVVGVDASREFQSLLDRYGKDYEIEIVPAGDHSWSGAQGLNAMQRTIRFLRAHLV